MSEQNWRFVETQEVRAWNAMTGEVVQVFTDLGWFVGRRADKFVPYARRVGYTGKGRHHARSTRRPVAWVRSLLRDLGDVLFGTFSAPEEVR